DDDGDHGDDGDDDDGDHGDDGDDGSVATEGVAAPRLGRVVAARLHAGAPVGSVGFRSRRWSSGGWPCRRVRGRTR
ncbi:MAG TPA: hypothetical protein DCS55_15595, partial [Acidimicrobiaceae bacterium]|nr:hypothetical protein [Acidimicrobiaceae bacterium]